VFNDIPLQGVTDEGFIVIAPDPMVDWMSVIMESMYTIGSTHEIRHYVPLIEAKNMIIDEKNTVIDNQAEYILELQSEIRDLGTSNAVLHDEVEEYKGLYQTWRTRTFVVGGVSIGILGIAGLVIWMM